MKEYTKISRRAFIGRSLTGLAALSLVPYIDLWAQQRNTVQEWASEASLYRFHLIGHGHIDPVWLWNWREGLSVVMSTFQAALDRMEENPEFKFTSSSVLFYRWVAENDPEMFRKIRKRIAEGRWDVVGGWWIEPDANLPGAEAFIRQGLYGQRELEKLIGHRAKTAFIPDSFGHSNCLPQILRQQGMTRYVFMRPMEHERHIPSDLFLWESPDGSRLLTYRIQVAYGNSRDIRERLERIIREFKAMPTKNYMAFYGAGDHGGGPTKKNFQQIAEIRKQTGAPTLIYSTPDNYFDEIEKDHTLDLPIVKDNLRYHAVGCYSADSAIKKGNRKVEEALTTAETISAIGSMAWQANYPKKNFTEAWQKVLFLQFHDSLAGSSLKEHTEIALNGYGYALETADQGSTFALQKLEWQIASEDPGSEYLVVFNPHAWEADCCLEYDLNIKEQALPLDDQGNPLLYQWSIGSSQSESVKKLIFKTTLPPMGYRQIRVIRDEHPETPTFEIEASERLLANNYLRVTFTDNGEIEVLDKETGQQLFSKDQAGCRAMVINDLSDTWGHGMQSYNEQIGSFGNAQFKVLENGPLRGMVRTTTFYGDSTLTIDWILYAQAKSIEARVQLDWHEKQKMLKFSFPVNLENPVATVEAPYAYSSIRQDGTEEPGHRWIDLSGTCNGESYGLSIINDAKYAYSVHGHDMRITIVRSPIYAINAPRKPDPSKEYPWMDQGIQTFNMKIVPHRGDWRQVNIPRQADLFCQPPITTYQGIHNGHLPKTDSFLKIDAPGIRITAIKQAESNNDLIIRCIESFGKRCVANIDFPSVPTSWRGEFTPFEIKSLRINPRNGQISIVNLLEE